MSRTYPYDLGVCPYSASTAMSCRDLCGLGVVEETLDFDEYEKEGNKMRRTVWEKMNEKELDMELNKDWADKVIEEAEEMDSIERSKYVRKKLAELYERIDLLYCLEPTKDVKNMIKTAEKLFDQLFDYANP